MSMVHLALRRPYTFIVMAMLIALATLLALLDMATDIVPAINIPVVGIIWNYSSPTLPEQAVFDDAVNVPRPRLITIPGAAVPFPYGGKNRLISVDLDVPALQAQGLSPADVVNAINLQNLILPSGTAKMGATDYAARPSGWPLNYTVSNG